MNDHDRLDALLDTDPIELLREAQEAYAEISRHHDEFIKIRDILTEWGETGNHLKAFTGIRSVVG